MTCEDLYTLNPSLLLASFVADWFGNIPQTITVFVVIVLIGLDIAQSVPLLSISLLERVFVCVASNRLGLVSCCGT